MIPAVVLAAGLSLRMRRSKSLLAAAPDGTTFVARLTRTLHEAGTADVLVVGREEDEPLRREVDRLGTGYRYVVNTNADLGQLSSLIAGLNAADRPGVRGILVTPVDAPFIRSSTVAALLARFTETSATIVRATFRGRHGHPVIFGRGVFDDLRRADHAVGAKAVLRAHRAAIVDVDTSDPGVVHDIDHPEEYERVLKELGRFPPE